MPSKRLRCECSSELSSLPKRRVSGDEGGPIRANSLLPCIRWRTALGLIAATPPNLGVNAFADAAEVSKLQLCIQAFELSDGICNQRLIGDGDEPVLGEISCICRQLRLEAGSIG